MSLFIRPVISKISCIIFCSLHISYCYIPPALNICADKTSSIVNQKTLQMMSNVKGCWASRSGSFCCFDSRCELWSLQQVGVINASRGCVWISQEQKELLGRHMMGSVRREIEDRLCPSLRERDWKSEWNILPLSIMCMKVSQFCHSELWFFEIASLECVLKGDSTNTLVYCILKVLCQERESVEDWMA